MSLDTTPESEAVHQDVLPESVRDAETAEARGRRATTPAWWHTYGRHVPILLLLLFIAGLCRRFTERGVDWGDDWALYVHQAKALVNGNLGEVVANNRYAIDNSGWNSFSPLVYPWGFPLLLAPFIALWGLNYERLKLVVLVSFIGFLYCMYRLVERRAGIVPALLVVALCGSSTIYVGWTGALLSDYPYLFAVGITMLWMDRLRLKRRFEEDGLRDLIILGVMMAYAFSTRREGAALVLALASVHLVTLGPRWWRYGTDETVVPIRWNRVLLPYISFAVSVITLQMLLPSVLYPKFAGTGTQQIKPNVIWYRDILAENIGIKDIGVPRIELFHSWWLAALVLWLFVGLAAVGVLVRLVTAPNEDVMFIGYLAGASYIIGTAPFHEGRYMLGFTPFMAYFAYQALPTITGLFRRFRPGRVVYYATVILSAAGLFGLVVANWSDTKLYAQYHKDDRAIINGPTTPAALEMEDVVRRCTRGDDVVVFFRARAMSLLTERKSIQTGNLDQVIQRGDWYVMNVGSTYSQPLVDDAQAAQVGLKRVWANAEWVLWMIPGGAADGRKPSC